jgi:alcohol dehydrogenase class IV
VIPASLAELARSVALPGLKRAAAVVTRRLPIPQPTMIVGPGSSARLGQAVGDFAHRRILIVTDPIVSRLGLLRPLTAALAASGTAFVVFDEITPDAPIPLVERGIELFRSEGCDAIIAFGGGSPMDAAKVIGLAVTNHKHPRKLVGSSGAFTRPCRSMRCRPPRAPAPR